MNWIEWVAKSRTKLIFLIVVLVSSLGQLTSDLYLPSLPAIAMDLHSNNQAAQWTLSIYMLGFAITQLLYGPISDGIGRRKPLLIGLMIGLVGIKQASFCKISSHTD